MRILLLDVNCKYSSTGKIVYDLYTQLNQNGHTAAIGYGRGREVKEPGIIKFSTDREVYFHAAMTRITGLTGCFSYFATKKLLQFIDEFQPDIVHLNDMHGYFVNIIPLIEYLKQKEIPAIWTLHCEFMYTGKCGHSDDCEKWKTYCDKCPKLEEYPESFLFDFTKYMFLQKKKAFQDFKNVTIVTPSNWLADRVRQSFLSDKNICLIRNGIDTKSIFYPRNTERLRKKHGLMDEKIILAVAPDIMSERKGGSYVIALARRMKKENVKFIMIGVTNTSYRFDENIIALAPTTNQDELAEYYSLADLFVICSKRENFPTTCLEALSCGTPVVGFDTGGTRETAPGELGEFVPFGNMTALCKAVRKKLSIAGSSDLQRTCTSYAQNHYAKETMVQQYLALYEVTYKERINKE